MSFKLAGWAWDQPVNATTKLVLLALAETANDDGECWPGRKHLAKKCSLSGRSITNATAALEAAGLLRIEQRFRDDGSQTSNRYFLVDLLERGSSAGVERSASAHDHDSSHEPVREPISSEPQSPPVIPSSNSVMTSPKGADVQKLITDFEGTFTEAEVREHVATAMNHKASKKAINLTMYCRVWLRREKEYQIQKAARGGQMFGPVNSAHPYTPNYSTWASKAVRK